MFQFGAVKAPAKPSRELPEEEPGDEESGEDDEDPDPDADADEDMGNVSDDNSVQHVSPAVEEEIKSIVDRKKKRKRRDENEEIEDLYLRKLQDADDIAERRRREKRPKAKELSGAKEEDNEKDDSDEDEEDKEVNKEFPIKHETLQSAKDVELEKSSRTIFLGNVPSTILSSKVSSPYGLTVLRVLSHS